MGERSSPVRAICASSSAFAAMPTLGEKLSARGGRGWDVLRYGVIPAALLLLSTAALVGDSYNPFIYFQF